MGMPAAGFVAAANLNRGFVDFLAGAAFEARPSISTASSAMDVGHPSNLERILWLYHGDAECLRRDVAGVSVTDAAARACMEETYARTGYVLDPHSAVAYEAHRRHHDGSAGPIVVLATADPAKFPEVVESVIGRELPLPAGLAHTTNAEEHMRDVPPHLDALVAVLDEATG
jgi:threonine synthase